MRTVPGLIRVSSGTCSGRMPSSPASPGAMTISASPEKIAWSAETMSTWKVFAMAGLLEGLRLLERFLDRAHHVEGLLGQRIAFAVDDHVEPLDRVLERHVLSGRTGEHLGDVEGLRKEALDLARAPDGELVLRGELVHAEARDNAAQLLLALQHPLHRSRRAVVVFADDVPVHLAGGRNEPDPRRVD